MMEKNYDDLFEGFMKALGELDVKVVDVVVSFPIAMGICQDYFGRLKARFLEAGMTSGGEEIAFFKTVKPKFYAERMLRFERYQLALNRPVGTASMVRGYLEGELVFVQRFFEQFKFQYLYYKSKGDEFDGFYFLRDAKLPVVFSTELEYEVGYSTGMDYLQAKFMAMERLQGLIVAELAMLGKAALDVGSVDAGLGLGMGLELGAVTAGRTLKARPGYKRFDWTGEVINLVELGYGLWLSGQLGDGKAGLQEIFRWLEESFGVDIGIPANRFREIRRRKRLSRTHFMELVQGVLLEYMEKDDAYVPGGKKGLSSY